MPKGYNGRILRVNLSQRKIIIERPNQSFYRRYMGGRALALYHLLREVSRDTDAFSPDNRHCPGCYWLGNKSLGINEARRKSYHYGQGI